MTKTSSKAVLAVIICTFFVSVAQLFWKLGADSVELNLLSLITNWPLIIGCVLYAIGAVIMIVALRYGELSVLYPFVALSFVWVALLSLQFLGEHMSGLNWLGILGIIIGVSLIGAGK